MNMTNQPLKPCSHCKGTGKELDQAALGEWYRERRKKLGLSLQEVADLLKIVAPYLSDFERGRRNFPPDRIEKLESVLNKPKPKK